MMVQVGEKSNYFRKYNIEYRIKPDFLPVSNAKQVVIAYRPVRFLKPDRSF